MFLIFFLSCVVLFNKATMSYASPNPNSLPSNNRNDIPLTRPLLKKKRKAPGQPDSHSEVIALSPKTLLTINRFVCELCQKGFDREQNLILHKRSHNCHSELKKRNPLDIRKKVYVCPQVGCVHYHPSRALGDITGIKKHFLRKHGEKTWMCNNCSKAYALECDLKAHAKKCDTREFLCDCGTSFFRNDSLVLHRALCQAPAQRISTDNVNHHAPPLPPCHSYSLNRQNLPSQLPFPPPPQHNYLFSPSPSTARYPQATNFNGARVFVQNAASIGSHSMGLVGSSSMPSPNPNFMWSYPNFTGEVPVANPKSIMKLPIGNPYSMENFNAIREPTTANHSSHPMTFSSYDFMLPPTSHLSAKSLPQNAELIGSYPLGHVGSSGLPSLSTNDFFGLSREDNYSNLLSGDTNVGPTSFFGLSGEDNYSNLLSSDTKVGLKEFLMFGSTDYPKWK